MQSIDTAYRYAKGLPVIHPAHRARVRIETPLDFLAVSDHAEFMGIIPMILANDPRVSGSETARRFRQLASEGVKSVIYLPAEEAWHGMRGERAALDYDERVTNSDGATWAKRP